MEKDGCIYDAYVKILNAELVPAMGCTDPIVIAYCAAKAKQALGCMPETLDLYVSGNLVKNAKCVVVPGTGGLIGMRAAAAAGLVGGDPSVALEVLSSLTPGQQVIKIVNEEMTALMGSTQAKLTWSPSTPPILAVMPGVTSVRTWSCSWQTVRKKDAWSMPKSSRPMFSV